MGFSVMLWGAEKTGACRILAPLRYLKHNKSKQNKHNIVHIALKNWPALKSLCRPWSLKQDYTLTIEGGGGEFKNSEHREWLKNSAQQREKIIKKVSYLVNLWSQLQESLHNLSWKTKLVKEISDHVRIGEKFLKCWQAGDGTWICNTNVI